MLIPLDLPPGVRSVDTDLKAKGRWRDCNLIRWEEGVMQPVGKWVRITPTPLEGRVCGMLTFRDNTYRDNLVVGTNTKAYAYIEGEFLDITPDGFFAGPETTTVGAGFGSSEYGQEDFGTPRQGGTNLSVEATNWSFDRWGEFAVGVSLSDGVAYVWKPGDAVTPLDEKMLPIDNAPTDNRALIVTNERHLMLLAAGGDPRKIQWSAREDYTDWTPTATNLAGDLILETSGIIQCGLKVGEEILVLSDTDAFRVRYVGQPFGYGKDQVGANCGVLGPHAAAATGDFAAWMGRDGFYMYRGQIQSLPCEVWDFVFRELNYTQRALISAGHNSAHGEIWWWFPVNDDEFNSRYVAWNYRENWWAVGYLRRTHWQERGVWKYPLASGEDGHIYEHEVDFDALGVANRPAPYAVSAPVELGNGEQVMAVTELVPDRDSLALNSLKYDFSARFAPRLPPTEFGPFFPNETGFTPVRFMGREVTFKVSAVRDNDWRLGRLRAEVKQGGRR